MRSYAALYNSCDEWADELGVISVLLVDHLVQEGDDLGGAGILEQRVDATPGQLSTHTSALLPAKKR